MKYYRDTTNIMTLIIFFFVWPFGSFIYSIINFKSKFSKNIVWLFAAYYGYTLVIPDNGFDAYRYVQEFQSYSNNYLSFKEIISNYLKTESTLDIYKPLLMWFVSRFTESSRIFYAIVGLVFGFFYSRNIWFVLDRLNKPVDNKLYLFILAFSFISPFFALQFIRFGTATQIFIYGTILLLGKGNRSGIWWASSSILVHFSFVLPFGLLLLFTMLPKNINGLFIFFLFATFLLELQLGEVRNFLEKYLPLIFQPKVESYTNTNYAESVSKAFESTNWYIQYRVQLFTYLSYGLIALIYFKGKQFLNKNYKYFYLFNFTLLIYGVANIVSIIPSGGRFISTAQTLLFVVSILFLNYEFENSLYKVFYFITMPILLLYIVVGFRYSIDTMGLMFFFGNPILAFFFQDTTPLINYIKAIFLS